MTMFWFTSAKMLKVGVILALGLLLGMPNGLAATITVDPRVDRLVQVMSAASARDTLRLLPGIHAGPLEITKPLSIIGEKGAIIKGNGKGSTITIKASGVTIKDVVVTGSGLLLETQDSGIFISDTAVNTKILDNKVENNLIGIYVWGAVKSLVKGNKILGRRDLRMNERGNGIQIWNAPGTIIEDNAIRYGRDGIFVNTSKNNIFRGNRFEDLRIAVHYMYTNNSRVIGNVSRGNHIGYAIMYSKNIVVANNVSENDRDRGLLFNFANKTQIKQNIVKGGSDKCVFIYNSNKNSFTGNIFSQCNIGVHFTAGSERNIIYDNAFIDNRTQVKYVGTRWLDWSHKGRGNFWSDNAAFDLDRNGIADAAYRPNDLTDQIIWRYPIAKLLTNSPAVQLLKWAQSAFPALHPGGVIDTAPLMAPPVPTMPVRRAGS